MSFDFLSYWAIGIYYISIIMYVCLDGFGIGLGCLHIFGRNNDEKRLFLNAVGPVWDGNAVWIVITTGILLAAFTKVFTSLLSGFYLPMMGLVFGFMIRSAAIEFRSKRTGPLWRWSWDTIFWLASLGMALDFGCILGHTIQGIPIGPSGLIEPHSFPFFSLYPLFVAFFTLFLFSTHGGMYLLNKVEGDLKEYIRNIIVSIYPLLIVSWVVVTWITFDRHFHMVEIFQIYPLLTALIFLSIGSLIFVPVLLRNKKDTAAFFCSCILLISFVSIYAVGMYPVFAYSSTDMQYSLTLFNSANSYLSLLVIFIVSLCGLPLSFFYFSYIYKVFRGSVSLTPTSY